jgi:hypothetical protein
MEKEENIYVKTEGTEEKVVVEDGVKEDCRESASAVPSKFKDVDALARAYSALQSEFTRRSQRLKELERKVENLEGNADSGVEKLRKNAQVRKAEMQRFDKFVAETERACVESEVDAISPEEPTQKQPLSDVLKSDEKANGDTMVEVKTSGTVPAQENNGVGDEAKFGVAVGDAQMQARGGEGLASVAGNEPSVTPSEMLYAQVCRDEGVRLRIIGEYLSSLGKSGAPLMTGGVGAFTTPPFRASNIAEAGNMALMYFKKPLNR